MNIAYSEQMQPPKELFSRHWRMHYDSLNDRDRAKSEWIIYEKVAHDKIDSINRKLEDLEQRLQKIRKIEEVRHFVIGKCTDYGAVLSTIGFLKKHIGIWKISTSYEDLLINMIYPNSFYMNRWNDDVLGPDRLGNICVIMLSPECVEWLNKVSTLVSE